jgi:protein arginine kinase activator
MRGDVFTGFSTMQCEKCHLRSATVHLRDSTSGRDAVLNLCLPCATKALGQDLAGGEVAQLIGELIAKTSPATSTGGATVPPSPSADPECRCASCGLTAAEFAHLGRLGCPACYQAFANDIEALLLATHGGTEHRGGRPPAADVAESSRSTEREVLQVELEQAVAEEAFERAAQLRDALRRLP